MKKPIEIVNHSKLDKVIGRIAVNGIPTGTHLSSEFSDGF